MRIEWLDGEKQFRLEAPGGFLVHEDDMYRKVMPDDGSWFVLRIPKKCKVWITQGENHGRSG